MSKFLPIFLLVLGFLLSACGGAPTSTPSPEPLATPTDAASTICKPSSNWTINYNRSGGFAGLNESMTLDSDGNLTVQSEQPPSDGQQTISNDQVEEITELLAQSCPFEVEATKDVCADCFFYDLDVQMNGRFYSVQASDVTLTEELQPLISVLSQLMQETRQ